MRDAPLDLQLLVLGVAQDAGHPQVGCDRACCAAAWADPNLRHRAACLGLFDPQTGQRWLVEATPDLPAQLRALDAACPRRGAAPGLDGLLLTHAHIGHYTGLMYLGREALGAAAVPVWAMPRMRAFLRQHGPWAQLVALGNIALRDLAEGAPVALSARLTVTAHAVPHRDEYSETVGLVLEGPQKRAFFLPDIDKWERWARPVESVIAEVDLAFLDGTFFDAGELPGRAAAEIPHPFVAESLARLGALPARLRERVCFIHLNHSNPLLDPDSAASQQVREAGFRVAVEGARFSL